MLTFADPLDRAELCHGPRVAVIDGDTRLTFADLAQRCRRLAGGIARLTQAGDRVAVLAPTSHHYLELYCAVPAAGRILVPLNTRLTDGELAALLADAEPTLLLTDRDPASLGDLGALVGRILPIGEAVDELATTSPAADLGAGVGEDDVALLLYTGGTTGASKGVMLTHRNKITDGLGLQAGLRLTDADTWLMMSPMFHAAGTFNVHACMWSGAAMVLLSGYEPALALDTIEATAATITFGVPTMLATLVDELGRHPRDVSSLRVLGYGAAPATSALLRRVNAALPHVELVTMYGATEMGPMGTLLGHLERHVDDDLVRSAGQPMVDISLRIVDERGDAVPTGEVGEVVVRGPSVMAGYWRRPDATADALRDGWYHSGDLGLLDEHGCLYLVDRKKDMVVTGGENVYSTEVEDVLSSHAAVDECAVFGVPHDRWGEAVHAIVVLRPGQSTTAHELQRHCRERLAGYKVPVDIDVWTEPLPKSAAGKILKRELRSPHWTGREREI